MRERMKQKVESPRSDQSSRYKGSSRGDHL